jgi:hypothetical protein
MSPKQNFSSDVIGEIAFMKANAKVILSGFAYQLMVLSCVPV